MQPPKTGFVERFLASLKCAPKRHDLIDPTRLSEPHEDLRLSLPEKRPSLPPITIGEYPATALREA